MQHEAKHALWALSQQKLPLSVLQPDLPRLCSLLYEHMALPLANRGCRHAHALALNIRLARLPVDVLSSINLPQSYCGRVARHGGRWRH